MRTKWNPEVNVWLACSSSSMDITFLSLVAMSFKPPTLWRWRRWYLSLIWKKWIQFGSVEMGEGHPTQKERNEQRPRSNNACYGGGKMNRLCMAPIWSGGWGRPLFFFFLFSPFFLFLLFASSLLNCLREVKAIWIKFVKLTFIIEL